MRTLSLLLRSPKRWIAQMAELVDALDSKSCFGNGVQVRFLFWAQGPHFWGLF